MRYSGPELLEGRIAPATLVNSYTVTFVDVDGDLVTVKTTAGAFTKDMFQFDGSSFDDAGPQQLSLLYLSAATGLELASISITATTPLGGSGNGLVNIGEFLAPFDLTNVTVDGDLGRIIVGGVADGTAQAINALKVGSLGARVTESQGGGADFDSIILGGLNQLSTKGDLRGHLEVAGRLGSATIGGDIAGFDIVEGTGVISAQSIGSVKVAGNITGANSGADNGAGIHSFSSIDSIYVAGELRGGGGANGAFIRAEGTLGTLKILGGIHGANTETATITVAGTVGSITIGTGIYGAAEGSAVISTGALGKLLITGDVQGGLSDTSRIEVHGTLGSARVTGKLIGGTGDAAVIYATGGINKISVGGLLGGGGNTASILSDGAIGSVAVLGSVNGGGSYSAVISGASIGKVTITGDLYGGGDLSGRISSGEIGSVQIYGSLTGNGFASGSIEAVAIDRVTIKGNINGGSSFSASIRSEGAIGSVFVGGYIQGGMSDSAQITAGGDIDKVRITGNLQGGGRDSASINAGGNLGFVRVGANVNGAGDNSARIVASGAIGKVVIGGNIQGGAPGSASIISYGAPSEAFPLGIGRVAVGGNISGAGDYSARIETYGGSIGSVSVDGSVQWGAPGAASIHAADSIKSIAIAKSATSAALTSVQFTAGNEIGKVFIGENFTGSIHAGTLGRITIGSATSSASVVGGGPGTGSISADGNISSITVYGNVQGNAPSSGIISAGGNVNSITITGNLTGQAPNSGVIFVGGNAGKIAVGQLLGNAFGSDGATNVAFVDVAGTIGSLKVANITGASSTSLLPVEHNASVRAGRINSAVIGDIVSGSMSVPTNATTIEAAYGIGSLTITGSIAGNSNNPVVIAAGGQAIPDETLKIDLAIGKVVVGGNVSYTNILAGYSSPVYGVNADAQIGSISIAGTLSSSNIVAGAARGSDNVFGTSDDAKIFEASESSAIISRIASISVGSVAPNGGAQFGLVAEEIGSLKIGGVATILAKGKGNDLKSLVLGTTLRELGLI